MRPISEFRLEFIKNSNYETKKYSADHCAKILRALALSFRFQCRSMMGEKKALQLLKGWALCGLVPPHKKIYLVK